MEKKEALREWCIEKAMTLLLSNEAAQGFNTGDVIKLAKELEAYVSKD